MQTQISKTVLQRPVMMNTQRGASLIEVMVSLLVLAIGILGILGMQAKSMQYNQSAHIYSQSIYLANDIAERIRSNMAKGADDKPVSYAYASAVTAIPEDEPGTNCEETICDANQMIVWDLYRWGENVKDTLPSGKATITAVSLAGAVDRDYLNIELSFDDSRSDNNAPDDNGSGRKNYQLMVEI